MLCEHERDAVETTAESDPVDVEMVDILVDPDDVAMLDILEQPNNDSMLLMRLLHTLENKGCVFIKKNWKTCNIEHLSEYWLQISMSV